MASQLNYDPAGHYRLCEDVPSCPICGPDKECTCLYDEPDLDLGDCAEQMREDSLAEDEASSLEESK